MLNVKPRDVEAILNKYQDPKDRLYHIILAFLGQAEPRPTWRVIVDALRSPVVNLTALARRVEAANFHDLTAARDVVPETTGKSLSTDLCGPFFVAPAVNDDDEVKPKPTASPAQSSTANSSPNLLPLKDNSE